MYTRKGKRKKIITIVVLLLVIAVVCAVASLIIFGRGDASLPEDIGVVQGMQTGEINLYNSKCDIINTLRLADITNSNDLVNASNVTKHEAGAVPYILYKANSDVYYAFDNEKHAFYEFSVKNNELVGKMLYGFTDLQVADYELINNNLYFITSDKAALFCYTGKNLYPVFEGTFIESFVISDEDIAYVATQDSVLKISQDKIQKVYLGDRTSDMIITDNYLFIANNFGAEAGAAVVHKFDHNLTSLGWAQIKSSSSITFITADDETVLVKQGVQEKKDNILKIADNKAEVILEIKRYHEKINILDNLIYGASDGNLAIYTGGKEQLFAFDGTLFLLFH